MPKTTASEKVLRDKAIKIAKSGLSSVVYQFFNKMSCDTGVESNFMSNQKLAKELYYLSKTILVMLLSGTAADK